METKKALAIGGGIFGAGLISISAYFYLKQRKIAAMVEEFMDKVARGEAAYSTAISQEDYEKADRIRDFYQMIMHEEEEAIKLAGGGESLIDQLRKLGIVVIAGMVAAGVIRWIMKRHPPPAPPKCELCGKTFPTAAKLEDHVKTEHKVAPEKVAVAEEAFRKLPERDRDLISEFSALPRKVIDTPWGQLETWQLILIVVGCILLIYFTGGALAPKLAPMLGMAI
ncbi:hypothetical protein ES704_03481 [subsurface metagenome]|jgi:uncharacterized membrane protein YraQ (UPF0718 family)